MRRRVGGVGEGGGGWIEDVAEHWEHVRVEVHLRDGRDDFMASGAPGECTRGPSEYNSSAGERNPHGRGCAWVENESVSAVLLL